MTRPGLFVPFRPGKTLNSTQGKESEDSYIIGFEFVHFNIFFLKEKGSKYDPVNFLEGKFTLF